MNWLLFTLTLSWSSWPNCPKNNSQSTLKNHHNSLKLVDLNDSVCSWIYSKYFTFCRCTDYKTIRFFAQKVVILYNAAIIYLLFITSKPWLVVVEEHSDFWIPKGRSAEVGQGLNRIERFPAVMQEAYTTIFSLGQEQERLFFFSVDKWQIKVLENRGDASSFIHGHTQEEFVLIRGICPLSIKR